MLLYSLTPNRQPTHPQKALYLKLRKVLLLVNNYFHRGILKDYNKKPNKIGALRNLH